MYIAGDGVCAGYLNNQDLTSKKFIINPYLNNEIIYDTGDLACFNDIGELIHLGRNDFQVKVNGHRIELEEIENCILSLNNINKCIVIKKAFNGHEFLCAYFVSDNDVNLNDIRAKLNKKLPSYMVPQYFVKLSDLPYTPNAKVDRKYLPEPNIEVKYREIILPRNNVDK